MARKSDPRRVARELTVDVPAADEAAAVAAVYALGVMGVQLRDDESGAPARRVQVLAWLPPTPGTVAAADALAGALGAGARVTWRDVPVTWDLGPAAHPVGARFAVVGPDAHAGAAPGRDLVVIEAALAFGDGLHPTTALCVQALERRLAPGRSTLDVGTGTGILAVVAARLGAHPVVACDIDPLAVWAARRTVAANHVDVTVLDALPGGTFDLVVANLYLAPLLALLPTLATRVAPGGALLLSGFRHGALQTVAARAAEAGLVLREVAEREGWVACVAEPRP